MKKYYVFKCLSDFLLAILIFQISLPILLLIAFAIKLDSAGPVFFLQERLGKDGKKFMIYKFRTMVDGAINMGNGLHTHEKDTRITKVGSILRKTSLDELPQILNILKGDMSFIGPRPPVTYYPREYDEYIDFQRTRFKVKPGITGYAQILLRNSASWNKRIELDVTYVNKMSLTFDIYIFFKTIWVVLAQENIYDSKNKNGKI